MDSGSLVAVPLPNGTFAILWIVEAGVYEGVQRKRPHSRDASPRFQFVVMAGFHRAIPKALAALRVAEDPSGDFPGRENVWKGCFFSKLPNDFTKIGARSLTRARPYYFSGEGTSIFQDGEHCRAQLFLQWRLTHDRPALEAEWARADAQRKKRVDSRRRTLTLPKMLRERIFESWLQLWPRRAVLAARRVFRDATRDLIALQRTGTRRQRIAVFKRLVTAFNALYDREGCIESVERDQIARRIDELARLVGLSNAREELLAGRDW